MSALIGSLGFRTTDSLYRALVFRQEVVGMQHYVVKWLITFFLTRLYRQHHSSEFLSWYAISRALQECFQKTQTRHKVETARYWEHRPWQVVHRVHACCRSLADIRHREKKRDPGRQEWTTWEYLPSTCCIANRLWFIGILNIDWAGLRMLNLIFFCLPWA